MRLRIILAGVVVIVIGLFFASSKVSFAQQSCGGCQVTLVCDGWIDVGGGILEEDCHWVDGCNGCNYTSCGPGTYKAPDGTCHAVGSGTPGNSGGNSGGTSECGGSLVNCPAGYVKSQPVQNVFCVGDYGGVSGAFCGRGPGTAQEITGCCNNMREDEDGNEVCGGGNVQVTTYTCVSSCTPSCGSPLCGQSDGCGGTCASWDQNTWGAWGACSATCGGGISTRTNACGNLQGQTCNTQSCQGPWWQVKDGDVTASGDIISRMPAGYYFDTIGSGGFPGVPVYRDQIAVTPGTISSTLWNANTATEEERVFNYSYFDNLIPDDVISGQLYSDGYRWEMITGNHTLPTTNFGATKNILFVNGNLAIDGNINLDDDAGFFLAIVKGTITINPTVTEIEGIYETDAGFNTGLGTTQLKVRGSVVSYGGLTLQRDLPDDTTTPAELFEFAPDQILLYPDKLGFRGTRWSEVAP